MGPDLEGFCRSPRLTTLPSSRHLGYSEGILPTLSESIAVKGVESCCVWRFLRRGLGAGQLARVNGKMGKVGDRCQQRG